MKLQSFVKQMHKLLDTHSDIFFHNHYANQIFFFGTHHPLLQYWQLIRTMPLIYYWPPWVQTVRGRSRCIWRCRARSFCCPPLGRYTAHCKPPQRSLSDDWNKNIIMYKIKWLGFFCTCFCAFKVSKEYNYNILLSAQVSFKF